MINGNIKVNRGRVSFSGLHNHREKELRFQDLKKPTPTSFAENSICFSNTHKNAKKQEELEHWFLEKSPKQEPNHNNSMKIMSRAVGKVKGYGSPRLAVIQKNFQKAQEVIKKHIEEYNAIFNEIIECLTDMQIKDLMKFNEMLERNEKIFQSADASCSVDFRQINTEQSHKIKDVQRNIMKIISQPSASFDFRSTYESKNRKIVSPSSSILSPKVSMPSQQARTNSLEDTPESVKSKLSCVSSKLKPQRSPDIGMFDRINICESIQQRVSFNSCSVKNQKDHHEHRYGRNSEE